MANARPPSGPVRGASAAPPGPGPDAPGVAVPGPEAAGPPDPLAKRPNTAAWDVLMLLDLVLIGFVILVVVGAGIFFVLTDQGADVSVSRSALWMQNAFNLVVFGLIPFGWAVGTRVGGWRAGIEYLKMDRPGPGFLWGLVLWVGIVVAVAALSILLQQVDPNLTENPALEGIGDVLTWPLVVATALIAGVAEEIFFRGFLQRWIGLWGQAFLFGLVHASYGTLLQIIAPFALGLLFGYLVRRGISLWAPITAHVLYDVVALSTVKYCVDNPEIGFCAG